MKKNILGFIFVLSFVFSSFVVYADDSAPVDLIPVVDPAPIPDPAPVLTENILIRDGATVIYSGTVNLPDVGTVSILDNNNVAHDVNTRSVLGVLYALDQANEFFSVSNLQYYDSFNSFYLKCITPSSANEDCDNWQYTVNNTAPSTGIDTTDLSGGENIGIYFGNPYRVNLDKNSGTTSDVVIVTAQKYNYTDDTWSLRAGVTVGVTQPDPANPWTPTTISEVVVDTEGKATLAFTNPGEYNVGIKEDYYFPSYPITITAPIVNGGGGGSSVIPTFSITNANNFLASNQSSDGSFGDILYTDWVAISTGISNAPFVLKLKNYLQNNSFESDIVTDNERHAMALSAIGINPYNGTSINYIEKIVKSFDGTQIGDANQINDDIFGLIILGKSGYTQEDDIISKDITYVINNQLPNGSWGDSVDMTAAGIQALKFYGGNLDAINRAESYITTNQNQSNGGFGNNFSTSWALQAMSLNSSLSLNVTRAENNLAKNQQIDGGMEDINSDISNRIWSTSYAIPALMHKSFSDSLNYFNKYVPSTISSVGNSIEIKKEIKKEEVIVYKDNLIENIPEITNKEILPIKTKVTAKAPKVNQIAIDKVDLVKNNEIKKIPDQMDLSAGAANSGVADKIYSFIGNVFTRVAWVFKGLISIFN